MSGNIRKWRRDYMRKQEKETRFDIARKKSAEISERHFKEKYPTCCSFWKGVHYQKSVQKFVRRITKWNRHYSYPVKFCPECGRKL